MTTLTDQRGGGVRPGGGPGDAFHASADTWGVRARVRVTICVLAPSHEDPSLLDQLLIGGFSDFRCTRPRPEWPLFRVGAYSQGEPRPASALSFLDPAGDHPGAPLLRAFCSGCLPPIVARRVGPTVQYEIGAGPRATGGPFTCYFGYLKTRAAPRFRTPGEASGEVFSTVTTPSEFLHMDLFVHRELRAARDPDVLVYGGLHAGGFRPDARTPSALMWVGEPTTRLSCEAGAPDSAVVPDYRSLVGYAFERAGWDGREFVGSRVQIAYPAMPSTVVMNFPLEDGAVTPSVRRN